MALDRAKLASLLAGANSEELHDAGGILREAWQNLESKAKYDFQAGDRVEFRGRYGIMIKGIVTSLGKSRVKVKADNGMPWSVAPTLLKKIKSKE